MKTVKPSNSKNTPRKQQPKTKSFTLAGGFKKRVHQGVVPACQVLFTSPYYYDQDDEVQFWTIYPAGTDKSKEPALGTVRASDEYFAKYAAYDAGIANPYAFDIEAVPGIAPGTSGVNFVEVKAKLYR